VNALKPVGEASVDSHAVEISFLDDSLDQPADALSGGCTSSDGLVRGLAEGTALEVRQPCRPLPPKELVPEDAWFAIKLPEGQPLPVAAVREIRGAYNMVGEIQVDRDEGEEARVLSRRNRP
jgi:hypothetical protein